MTDDDTLADYWRDVRPHMKQASVDRRARNRKNGASMLERAGVPFVSKNEGAHLIVRDRWDYWPGTGLWSDRRTQERRRGIHSLFVAIGRANAATQHSGSGK